MAQMTNGKVDAATSAPKLDDGVATLGAATPGSPPGCPVFVAVHRLAEEEPLERRRPDRLDQDGALPRQPRLQRLEVRSRMEQRDVAAVLRLVRRDLEPFRVEHVHFLSVSDVEPDRLAG